MSGGIILDLLERKGTVQIIVEIGHASKTFDQLEESILASSSTVSKRLNEGIEANLFDVTLQPTDYGTRKRYELDEAGKILLKLIQELDIDSTVRKYQRVTRRFDQETDSLIAHASRHIQIMTEELPPGRDVTSDLPPPEEIPEERREVDIDMGQKRRDQLEENLIGGLEYDDGDREDDGQSEDERSTEETSDS